MCTYNGSRYLDQQLRSIAGQTRLPSELVVCDDGSTDQTEQIVLAFSNSVTFDVHFRKNPVNLGSTKNFEQAIQLCTGDVIALCDQDDVWFPEKLQRMSEALEARPEVAAVFSNARVIGENGQFLPHDLWYLARFTGRRQKRFSDRTQAPYVLVEGDTVTGAAFMIRTSFVSQVLPISVEWIHDGWIAMILTTIAEVLPLPDYLMSYRLHTGQQVGLSKTPLYKRFSVRKAKALATHQHHAKRYAAVAAKLESLSAHVELITELRRKARFYDRRATILSQPRFARILPLLRSLPDHTRFAKNVASIFRDFTH